MRNSKLAVIISSTLLAAMAAHADPTQDQQTQQQTQSTTTQSSSTYGASGSAGASAPSTTSTYNSTTTDTTKSTAGTDADSQKSARWTQADTDGNGTLSLAEIQASMPTAAQNFAQMDANSDGQLTHEEMHAYKMQNSQNEIRQQFSAADRDSNKLIDQTEAASLPMLADQFAKVDVNSDGNVSMDEMQAYHHEMDQDWHDANKTTHDETLPSQDADQSRSTTTTKSSSSTTTTGETGAAPTPSSGSTDDSAPTSSTGATGGSTDSSGATGTTDTSGTRPDSTTTIRRRPTDLQPTGG